MKTKNNHNIKQVNPVFRITAAFMLLFAFTFTACSGTLFKNLLRSLERIEVSPGLVNIANGTTTQFTVTAIFSDGTKTDISSNATWESSNPNVATITSSGLVTAKLKNQTMTVTAAYKGLQSTATVNVTDALLVSLQVSPGVKSIANGTTYNFYATGLFTDNTTQDLTTQAAWTGGSTVCSVGANTGLVTGLSAGGPETITATVTVGTVTRSDTADVTVTSATLTAITTSVTEIELIEGTTYQLHATAYFSDSSTQDITTQAAWSSDDTGVCTVGAGTGLLEAQNIILSSGTATITVTVGALTATTAVTVTDATIDSIAVTPVQTIAYGTNVQFKAVATLSNGKQQDVTTQAVWSSLNLTVATISNAAGTEGLATSVGAGDTTIYATILSEQGSAALAVRIATLQSLAISYETTDVNVGGSKEFHVEGTFWDGSLTMTYDITDQVSWTSSNNGVADISNAPGTEGLATGITGGTVTITATRNGITDTATLNVVADTTPPTVNKAELLLGDRVRVTYSEDMNIAEATDYANYKIADTVGGSCGGGDTFTSSVQTGDFAFATGTPIVVESLRSYILQLDNGTDQQIYTLIANDATDGIRDTAGNDLDCPTNQYSFAGLDTVKPYMVNVINTGRYITVRFSEAMKTGTGDTQSADFEGSYALTLEPSGATGLAIQSVASIDAQTYRITLDAQVTSGAQYRLTVNSNVRDNSSLANTIGTPRYLSFTGNETLKVVSAEETVMGTVIITFNKAVLASSADADDATCENLYKIYPYAGNLLTATTGTGAFSNTVTLTYNADTGRFATAYTVIVANGLDGDNFDNVTSGASIFADPYNASDFVQAEPKDRATFQGLGQVINNFEDGTFFEDPFVDGTSFAFAFSYGSRVYLGTNDLNNAAFRFDPSGANSVLITFASQQYVNTFPDPDVPSTDWVSTANGFGNTIDSGFHGEQGVVGFNSVKVNFTGNPANDIELLLVGPLDTGGVNYGYFTQDLDTELNWIPFSFSVTGGANTQSIQTVYGFGSHLYLGFSSAHNNQKPIVAHFDLTESSGVVSVLQPELVTGNYDMGIKDVDGLGDVGINVTSDVIGVDSIIYHDTTDNSTFDGYLYMANCGGVRASNNYGLTFGTTDVLATPSGFTGTTLYLPIADGGLLKISPGQKGIPVMMQFNGKLYMARNVAVNATETGEHTALRGELWEGDPTLNGNPAICEPDDWTRIISGTETELGTASAISMLIANGSGVLYVGFDDPSGGVRIFKYTGTDPAATVTTMLSAGWIQQGVTGLGGSYIKILSSASISDGVYNYIYVTTVKSTGAIRVFRQID